MEQVIGSTGAVLPELPDAEAMADRVESSGAQLRERIHRAMRAWRDAEREQRADRPDVQGSRACAPEGGSEMTVACVAAPRTAVLALVIDGAQAILAAAMDGAELTENASVVLGAIELVAGADAALDDRVRTDGISRAESWLARRAGAQAGETLAWRGASRRIALRRIAGLAARAPHHRRALLAPLAMAARRVVTAPYALGAERVLDELASAPLPDEAWLRALASFGAMHGAREDDRDAARLVAVIVAG
jgi:hypothetical protein